MQLKTAKNVLVKWGKGEEIPIEINIKINIQGTNLKDIEVLSDIDGNLGKKQVDSINLTLVITQFVAKKILKLRKTKCKNTKLLKGGNNC